MSLEFKSNSTGGGGGETLAQTLVIGNTTGVEDIIQTDNSVFRCNDENGLQFASTSGEVHTNGGVSFTTRFNTNSFDILDLSANALFYIRSLTGNLLCNIGSALLGNGAVFSVDDDNSKSYFDNTAHDIKVGINKAAPSVALDVVGELFVNSPNQLFLGDDNIGNTFIRVRGSASTEQVLLSALNEIVLNCNRVNLPSLTNYATNAAAITGGLVAGDLYYTNTAGQAVLKIVI